MTHWRTLLSNSQTLSAIDLGDRSATATISEVEGGIFENDGGKDKTVLVSFDGRDKKFASNVTNCTLLDAMFGPEIEQWVGHRITLMADVVEKGGKKGEPCVRVKGSPELTAPMTVTVQWRLPGGKLQKPFDRVLVPTGKAHKAVPATETAISGDSGASEGSESHGAFLSAEAEYGSGDEYGGAA